METQSNSIVKTEIQKTLLEIQEITVKIKTELSKINQLVEENGQLRSVITSTNDTLLKTAENVGINIEDIVNAPPEITDDSHQSLLLPITSLTISEKLSSYVNDQQTV